jgi:O-antigen/teichoic acid export membrane protein
MRDIGALVTSRLGVGILGWAGTLLIIRSLSVVDWGEFSFVFSLLSLLTLISASASARVAIDGFDNSEQPALYVGSYVVLRATLGLLAFCLALVVVFFGHYPQLVQRATEVAGAIVVLSGASAGFQLVLQVDQQLHRLAVAQILGQAAQFVLTVVLVRFGASMPILTVPAVLCEVVTLGWTYRSVRSMRPVRYRVLLSTWGRIVRGSIPIAVGSGIFMVMYSSDSVLLSKLADFRAVAIYGIGYKFAGLIAFIPYAAGSALLGNLVRSWPGRPEDFFALCRRSATLLVAVGLIIAVEFAVFAAPTIRLLYGAQYVTGAGAARLVVSAACLSFLTILATDALAAQGRNRVYLIFGTVGLIVNVGLNLIFIPHFSYHASAWITLGTELIVVAQIVPLLRQSHGRILDVRALVKLAACGGAAAALAEGLRAVLPWPAALVLSALAFVATCHFGRVFGSRGLRSITEEVMS